MFTICHEQEVLNRLDDLSDGAAVALLFYDLHTEEWSSSSGLFYFIVTSVQLKVVVLKELKGSS